MQNCLLIKGIVLKQVLASKSRQQYDSIHVVTIRVGQNNV